MDNYKLYGPYFGAESNAWATLALLSDESPTRKEKAKKVANFMKRKLRIRTKPKRIIQGTPFSGRYIEKPWSPNVATYANTNGICGVCMLNTKNKFVSFDTKRYMMNVFQKKGRFISMNWSNKEDPNDLMLRGYSTLFLKGCGKKTKDIINYHLDKNKCTFLDEALLRLSLGETSEAEKILEYYKSKREERIDQYDYRVEHDSTMAIIESILGKKSECLNNTLDMIFEEPHDNYPRLDRPIIIISQTILALRPKKAKELLFL